MIKSRIYYRLNIYLPFIHFVDMETLDFSFHEDDSDEAYSPVKSKKAKASSKASSGQTIYDWDIQDLKTLCKRIRE